jgi:hypothetical protein
VLDLLIRRFNRSKTASKARDRFILIRAWGCGFCSDLNHVFGCLLLAEITGRIPVTHWGRNSLYGNGTDADAFRLYFEPLSSFGIRDLEAKNGRTFFPPKWSTANLRSKENAKWKGTHSRMQGAAYLGRPEDIAVSDFYVGIPDLLPSIPSSHELAGKALPEVYRYLSAKYIRVRSEIRAEIDEFHHSCMTGAPIIAVHYRGTDKICEADYMPTFETYFEIIDREARDWPIFVLTEEVRSINAFRDRYGSRVIFTDAIRSTGNLPAHHIPGHNRVKLGVDIVKDVQLAIRCQKFIGMGMSNPSCIVSLLKEWGEGDCILLGPSVIQLNSGQTSGYKSS